jgi:hypothetical protein
MKLSYYDERKEYKKINFPFLIKDWVIEKKLYPWKEKNINDILIKLYVKRLKSEI